MASKSKIGLIIKHEYMMRVRKKSFWLVGIITPIAIVAVGALIGFLSVVNKNETSTLAVYDLSAKLAGQIETDENLKLLPLDVQAVPLDSAKAMVGRDGIKGLLVIPADTTADYAVVERGLAIYYDENIPMSIQSTVSRQVERIIKDRKIELLGVDPKVLAATGADVSIRMVDISKDSGVGEGTWFKV